MMVSKPASLDLNAQTAQEETVMDENSLCPGCRQSVVDDSGGVVVAFG
jgi:hypothetical protein